MAQLSIRTAPLKNKPKAQIATLKGSIKNRNDALILTDFFDKVQKEGCQTLIADLSQVMYINSTGFGAFIRYSEQFKEAGGTLALVRLDERHVVVAQMLGLVEFLTIHESLDAATAALFPQKEEKDPGPIQKPSNSAEPLSVADKEPEAAAISVSLPARSDCGEGLLHLVTSVFSQSLQGQVLEAVRVSIFEVTQVIEHTIYKENPGGMYHVAIGLNGGKAEIRVADHGASVDTSRLPLYFPQATRYMDTFECLPHPKGGNVIRMTKAA